MAGIDLIARINSVTQYLQEDMTEVTYADVLTYPAVAMVLLSYPVDHSVGVIE